jgi:hypothetical protein
MIGIFETGLLRCAAAAAAARLAQPEVPRQRRRARIGFHRAHLFPEAEVIETPESPELVIGEDGTCEISLDLQDLVIERFGPL